MEPIKDIGTQEDTIFTEEELLRGDYDKQVKQARNAIFVVAAIQFIFGFFIAFSGPEELKWFNLGIMTVIAFIFAALGFWANFKPYPAILIALILYTSLILFDAVLNPGTIIRGIILKVIVIVYLIKGLSNAREAQRLKNILKG